MPSDYKSTRAALYDRLQNWGVDGLPSSKDEFVSKLDDENTRKGLHKRLQNWGVGGVPDWNTFNSKLAQPSSAAPKQEVNNTFTETELQKQKVNDNSPAASKPVNTSKSNINPRAPIQLDDEAKKKLEGAMSPVATSDTTSSPSEARRKEAELTQRTENLNAANPDKKQLSVRHKTTPAQGNEGPQTEQRLLNDEEAARQSLSEIMFNKEVDASASDIATSIAQERNLAQNIFDIAKQSGIDVFKQMSDLPNNPNAGYANLMRNTRISNEQREKITRDLSASLAANIQHLLFPQYASRIIKEAERLGVDFNQYAQYVGRVLLDNVQGELSQRLIDEGVPQNDVDYILYNLKNSITGVIASAATQTPEQFTADRMALEQYKEQKNPSFWTNLTAEAAKFVADTPYFMLGGEVGSATGRALMEREISTLIKRYGVERATAERILNTALKKSPALNMAQNTATRVAHSGTTLGTYNVMSTAAQQIGTQEFDPFEILKSGLEGEMMGTIIGLPSGVIGTLANETSGLKRVLLDLAGFSAEVGAFTSADQFLNYLSGGDEKPWGDAFAESFGQVLAMRLGSPATYARTFKILTDPKAAYNTPYERMQLTKSERAELDKYYGTYFDDLEKWDSSRSGSEENKPLEDRMREFYNDVEQDSRISWGTRAKLAVVAGDYNQLYTPVLAGYGSDWSSQTGRGVITTYDSRGRKIEEETFSNKKKYDERVSNINNALAEYRLNQIQDRDDLDPRFMDKARASLSGLGEEGLNDAERRIWEAWTAKQEYDDAAADENTSKETLQELENRKNQAIAQLNPNDMELLGNWANEVVRYRAAIAEADNLVNGSNTRGYVQSDPQSLVQNNIAVMVANNGAKQNLTEEIRQQLDSDPITTLADLKIASDEADERTEEGKKAKNTYKFAEQYVRYKSVQQGMEEAQTDRVNAAVEGNNRQIDAVTSKGVPDSKINPQAGFVIPVRLKGDNEEYHVVGGNVFSTSDGSIDIVRSSGLINVIDRNGNVSCVSPDDIASVGQAQSADLMKQQQGYSIRQQMQQQYQNAINGIVDFNAGDTYTLRGGDGKPFKVTVVGNAVDKDGQPIEGQVVVRTADGKETTMSRQDIQNMKSDADVHLVTDRDFQNEVEKLDNPPAETAPTPETPPTEAPTNEENPTTEPATYATGDKITLKVGDDEVKGRVDSVDGDNVSFTTVKKVQLEGEEEASNTHTLPADALSGYITEHTPVEPAPETPTEPETPAGPPTILQQITDSEGNIHWESVAPAQTLEALVEQAGGNSEIAVMAAEAMAESSKIAVRTAKGKVTKTRNEVEKAIADAQGVLDIALQQQNERVKGNDPTKIIEEINARNKAVTDAQDALKKAQEDGDRAIKEAEDGVVEAQRKADHWDEVLKVARGDEETPPTTDTNPPTTDTNPPTGGENPPTEVKLEDNPAFQQFSNALTERIKSIKAPIVLVGSREEMLDIAKREGIGQLTEDNVDDVNAFVVGKGENAKIYFYMPNLFERGGRTVEGAMLEAWRKIRHEADVHFGLREMLGNDGFNTILNRAYKGMSDDLRANFLKYNWDNNLSSRQKAALLKQADTESKAGKAKWDELSDEDRNKLLALGDTKLTQGAAEEYIAHLAEKIKEGQKLTVEEKDLWDRILAWLNDIFGKSLTEEELTDLILLSHAKLEKPAEEKPAEGGGEPPAGGETPPTGGETPPTGGGTPPAGGGETPAGGGEGPRWEDTQIGRRYTNQKIRHPEGLMLLDMDDHYELYGEDALNAAKALKTQATENEFGIPYLSIDKRGADDKITDLVRAGYKINKSPLEGSEPEPEAGNVETAEQRRIRLATEDLLARMEDATTKKTRLALRNRLKEYDEKLKNGEIAPTDEQKARVEELKHYAGYKGSAPVEAKRDTTKDTSEKPERESKFKVGEEYSIMVDGKPMMCEVTNIDDEGKLSITREDGVTTEIDPKAFEGILTPINVDGEGPLTPEAAEAQGISETQLAARTPDWLGERNGGVKSRQRGYRQDSGHIYWRKPRLDGIKTGSQTLVSFGSGMEQVGRMALIELSDLQASHNVGIPNPYHFISEAQPKDRRDEGSINAALDNGRNLKNEQVIGTGLAFTGAPVINARGEVIQGNSRADALRVAYRNYPEKIDVENPDPKTLREGYRDQLRRLAPSYGLDPADVDRMKNPVLVRLLDVNDDRAIALGKMRQQDAETGGETSIDAANAASRLGEDIQSIANILFNDKDQDTSEWSLSDFLSANGKDVLDYLVGGNPEGKMAISRTDYDSAFTGDGRVSVKAKEAIRDILFQSVFSDMANTTKSVFNGDAFPDKARKALYGAIFNDFKSPDGERLIPTVQEAIEAYADIAGSQYASEFLSANKERDVKRVIDEWRRSTSFNLSDGSTIIPSQKFSPFAIDLAGMFRYMKQNELKKALDEAMYITRQSAEPDIFLGSQPIPLESAIKTAFHLPENYEVKLSDKSAPKKEDNTLFSVGNTNDVEVEPVEVTDDNGRKSLVGIHNMTLRNIEGAMGLGGVANPSTAVVDIDRVGHRHFGAYSLIAPSGLVDDITTNSGFARAGDAYSVNFPKLTNRDGKTYIAGTDIEANLKNISDYMNSVAQAQGRSAGIAQGSFLAPILKELNSLDDMRQQRDRLSENYDHDLAEFNAKWRSVKVPLIDKLGGEDGYGAGADRFVEVIQQADPKQFARDNYDINLTDADVKDLQDYIRAVQEDMPVRYFEAKSNRPLYFNEFAGAVIPDDAPQNVVDFLKNQGLDVRQYEAGDESDRLAKVRQLANGRDDVRFSMGRNEEAERTLTQVGGQKQPDTNYDTSELDDVRFSIGKRKMAEMDKRLAKARPDMTEEQRQALYDYLDTLGSTARQNATFHWFAKGTIKLPEDQYKVDDALSVASKVKDDPLSSNSPLEFMAKYPSTKPTRKPINPDTVPTLTNKKDYGDGVTVYDVDESEESRKNMRAIIDTHWGDKANPWCLLEKNPETGELTSDSRDRWYKDYSQFGKKVAFKDGKLLAFFASDSKPEWWDRIDHPHTGIPVAKKMDDDAEGRSATYEFKIPIEDIKDLETKYHGLSWPDSYGESGWGAPKDIHRGNKQNGKYEEWYDNGQKKEENYWEDGSPRGTHRTWDEKGRLRGVCPYDEDGHRHGVDEGYYASGRLKVRMEFNHGNILHLESYYRNGRLQAESSYEDNEEHTCYWSRSYFEDGQLQTNSYLGKDGLQHEIEYYSNGQKASEETRNADYKRVGYQATWYENGQLCRVWHVENGKQDGVQVRYSENGRISEFWEYKNGLVNGTLVAWNRGTLAEYIEKFGEDGTSGFRYSKEDSSTHHYFDNNTPIPEEEGQRMLAERMAVVERRIAEANEAVSQEEPEARFSIGDTASTLGRNLGKEIDVTDEGRREQDRYILDPETGKISLVSKNNRTAQDAERSILTALTQRGNLRDTFGVEDYDDFIDDIYQHSGEETRREITNIAMGNGLDFRKATEQYLADAVTSDNFDPNSPWWRTIKRDFQAMIGERGFNEITKRAGFGEEGGLSDNDLRYILWKNYRNDGTNRGAMGVAEDVAMQDKLGVGNYALVEPEVRFSVGDEITGSERRAETISRLVDMMNTYRDDLEVRNNAMQGITDAFHAIQAQGKYDRATVQTLTDAINKMIQDDLLDPSRGDTKRILSAVKNGMDRSVGGNETRFRDAIYSLGNVLADNQLRVSRAALDDALSVQTEKIGTDRIKKQGAVDGDTAEIIKRLKKLLFGDSNPRVYDGSNIYGKYDLDYMKEELKKANTIMDDPYRTEVEKHNANLNATAYELAIEYANKVEARKNERKELHEAANQYHAFLKKAVEDGTMTPDEARKERKEYDAILKDKLLQSKFDAGAALHDIAQEVISIKNEGIAKAKNFFEKNVQEKESETTALLNDLGGIASTAQKNTSLSHRIGNSAVAQLTAAPLLTYEQLFKVFGRHSADGQGWLYNKYVGGWYDAATKEAEGYQDSMNKLNAKAAELFGKGTRYTNLYDLTHKTSDFTLSFYDNGTPVERKLTIGNLLYVYMVDKMIDGQMKLRKMGINGDKVAKIKASLDPRLIELADWIQGEFLPKTRERYNETYKQLYGLSMDNIPNYVPLNILSNAVPKENALAENVSTENIGRISTTTSAIKTRSVNTMPIDLVNSDALSLIFDHVEEMEHWSAFAPLAKSLNMLLGDPAFRNRVMNMTTMYGAGETLLKAVENVCRQALGDYIPQRGSAIDKGLSKWGQAVASSKIAFRLNTALKQFISMANYIPDVNLVDFAKAMGQGVASVGGKNGTWQWAMENLPLFKKRWESRTSGDTRLVLTNDDFAYWRKGWVERIRRWGITPNAFIDAVTVSVGAKAIYDTKYKQYIKDGYSEEQADKKAKQDAVLLYNQTQQSAEGAFISTMQSDRTVISMAATLFRNASMSYTRQVAQAARNLQRMAKTPKAEMVESMKGQYLQDGLTEEQAQAAAERRYNRALRQELTRLGVFAYIAPFLWRAGGHWLSSAARLLPALFGQNVPNADDERQQWVDDAMQSAWGPLEGMPFGNAVSDEIYSLVTEGKPSWKPFISYPLFDDIGNASEHWQNENAYQAINEIVNLGASLGLGASPQALEDAIAGMIDYCESEKTARDALILLSTLTSMPHSQINKLRLDEMDLSGEEALRLTPQEFVERYADAQKMHNAGPFTPLMGEKESEKYTKSATTKAKEQLSTVGGTELNKAYDAAMEQYNTMKDDVSTISKELKADEENLTKEEFDDKYGARVYDWLQKGRKKGKLTQRREQVVEHVFNEKYGEGKYAKYKNVAVEDKKLNTAAGKAEKGKTKEETQALVKRWLNAKTPEEELELRKQIEEGKRAFVEASNELNKED